MRLAVALLLVAATFTAGCSGSDPGPADDPVDGSPPAGNVTGALPAVTHFEFGESAGCAGDVLAIADSVTGLGINCVSFMQGPDGPAIDGHWLALDETYWGLQLTSTVTQSPTGPVGTPAGPLLADSDCVVTDEDLVILAEGNNGASPCTMVVPERTAFLFVYPYGNPATAITVDFAVA